MANSFVYDLAMALIPGAVAGYYSGLLMAKQAKFNSLKHEALRCVRVIDYMGDERRASLQHADRLKELHLIASELMHLRHTTAGTQMAAIAWESAEMVATNNLMGVPIATVTASIADWQQRIRQMRPGLRLIVPWGQI